MKPQGKLQAPPLGEAVRGLSTLCLFPGSFDPFTIGHDAIVRRALKLFGRVVVAVGVNERKQCMATPEERAEGIRRLYASEPRVSVETYSGLTVDLAHRLGASAIVRGVRSIRDFEYEREQADVNFRIGGIDTVLLIAEAQYASISSGMVRELIHFGHDVEEFLPKEVKNEELRENA